MDGSWWEPEVSLLEWEIEDELGEEARMAPVMMDFLETSV